MNKPKISIVMAMYNGERYLKEAIESVLNQTEKDFEFIIVDDGSTDDSQNIIKSFSDERIKYFRNEHKGLVDSLNFGIEKSDGEFIARFDADDICESNRLEEQIKLFEENPENVLVGSLATIIDEGGLIKGDMDYPKQNWQEIRKYSLLHNPFIHSSVMFRREVVYTVGYYKKFFKYAEDYELWTRIINKYPCVNIPKKLIKYRVHNSQITKKSNIEMRLVAVWVRILAFIRFIF